MKIFHCDHCGQLVFFENVHCLSCGHALAYVPDVEDVLSLEAASDGAWRAAEHGAEGRRYRLCANYDRENVCNWAIAADDPETLCVSCRLTRTIPDLGVPGHRDAWYRLEVAKRRPVVEKLRFVHDTIIAAAARAPVGCAPTTTPRPPAPSVATSD